MKGQAIHYDDMVDKGLVIEIKKSKENLLASFLNTIGMISFNSFTSRMETL